MDKSLRNGDLSNEEEDEEDEGVHDDRLVTGAS